MSADEAAWGHARIPRATPPSARSALLSLLVLLALIAGGCLAAAASGPAPVRAHRQDFLGQPLVPRGLTPVTRGRRPESRLAPP